MTGIVWGSIFGGLAIVILAVGIPYYLTHRHMRPHYDRSEGKAYLRAKRSWLRRRRKEAGPSDRPDTPARRREAASPSGQPDTSARRRRRPASRS